MVSDIRDDSLKLPSHWN